MRQGLERELTKRLLNSARPGPAYVVEGEPDVSDLQ
jgi:hypothetical protein